MTKEERMKQRGVWKNNPEYKEKKSAEVKFIPADTYSENWKKRKRKSNG